MYIHTIILPFLQYCLLECSQLRRTNHLFISLTKKSLKKFDICINYVLQYQTNENIFHCLKDQNLASQAILKLDIPVLGVIAVDLVAFS